MEMIQIFLFSLFCFLVLIYKRSNSKKSKLPLPPGPPRLPLIGNIHQLVGALPHHSITRLAKKYGPLMYLQLGETSNVVVSSSEMAKEVYQTHDLVCSNRPDVLAARIFTYNNTDIGFAPYGTHWRHLRKISTLELLTAKRVKSFRFIREEELSALVKDLSSDAGSVVNLSAKIIATMNNIVARSAFGKKSRDQEAFLSTVDDFMKLLAGFSIADLYPSIKGLQAITGMQAKIEKIHKLNDQIMENIIRDHKESKAGSNENSEENILDVLLKIQQEKDREIPLTHTHVKAVILDIFIGGSETSSTTLVWAISELMRNPKMMERAQAEVRKVYHEKGYVDESELHQLKYLNAIMKETLRLHPPGPLLVPRSNVERCVINGYEIPEHSKIIINAYAIGRDPKYWDEPLTFKPERFLDSPIDFKGSNLEFVPFGAGRRICPGINFATAAVEIILSTLLYHFDWKLPNGITPQEFDMTETDGAIANRKEHLLLVPRAYQP